MTLRVAVATDDGNKVKEDEFHRAKYFAIFDLTGRSPTRVELRVNTRRDRKEPASVLEILRDCEVLVAGSIDDESREIMESLGVIAHATKRESVESAVLEIAEGISKLS